MQTKEQKNKKINESVSRVYSSVKIRKDILQELIMYAESHGVDKQEALRMLLNSSR